MITRDLSLLVAIASGTRSQVRRWSELLQKAAIEFHVAESIQPAGSNASSYAELWVMPEDVNEARDALRRSGKDGEAKIW